MRTISRLMVVLLLGVLIAVGVSWGLAVYTNPLQADRVLDGGSASGSVDRNHGGTGRLGGRAWWSMTPPADMPAWFTPPGWAGLDAERERPFRMAVATGWPCIALASDYGYRFSTGFGPETGIRVAGDWDWVDGQVVATSLAVRPLWGGLLVNVLLYSLVAYVLVCLPGDVRRKKRDRAS